MFKGVDIIWFENIRRLIIAIILFICLLLGGTVGFYVMGGKEYTLLDSLYMTVITISTVGFTEVHPLDTSGRIFTIVLILSSFGILGYLAAVFSRFLLEGIFRKSIKNYKMNKKISKLNNHIIICGYGRNGKQAALELQEHGQDLVIIDNNEKICEKIYEDDKHLYVLGDARENNILQLANIDSAKALIATIPSDADNMFIVVTARQMNESLKIISRCSEVNSEIKLRQAGADNVIMPDLIGGQKMAKLVVEPDIIEFLDYILLQSSKNVCLEEISCKNMNENLAGKTIKEIGFRNRSGVNIIGLRLGNGQYVFNPEASTRLLPEHQLFILGNPSQIADLKYILK